MIRLPRLLACTLAFSALVPYAAQGASTVEKLQEFPLDEVQITDDYQQNLFDKDVTYLIKTLNMDRLLAGFKAVSQGTSPVNLYGGWEGMLIRGHFTGHWLSAVAHAYKQTLTTDATLNGQIKTKLDYVIGQLKSFQLANGFLFATSMDQFDAVEGKSSASQWVPWYTMHKILAGLVDVYAFEGNADALAVASKLGDWIAKRATAWDSGTRGKVLGVEYGGMNDALYELYKYTNSADHLAAAHVFDETNLFTPIASGTDNLNGMHANATIPKFLGALNRYRAVGASEQSYFTAADQFLSIVLKDHTFVTGGHGQDEHFHQPGKLDAIRDNVNNESCNAYNMSKLTRELFKIKGDVKYADYYEKVHINEVLAAINPSTGMTTYFKPMGTGYFKAFATPENSFYCCTGSGTENYTKLGDSVYFHDATDLWVTYYVSSSLSWKERGLALTQTTDLPLSNKVTFSIDSAPTDAVNIKFRVPYWIASCQNATVTVNGAPVDSKATAGFITLSQAWKAGDKIELTFPMEVQVSRLPDNANAVAFTYGPIVLSAGLGTASMTTTGHALTIAATKPSGLQDTITINSSTTINAWLANINANLVQTPGKLEFNLKNTDSDGKLVFTPHYQRYQDRYGIYFKLAGSAGTASAAPACTGTGGSTGAGGAGATGGKGATGGVTTASGGAGGAVSGGAGDGTGGATASGGVTATGGADATGGVRTATGGTASGTGGTTGATGGSKGGVDAGAPGDGTSASGCSREVGGESPVAWSAGTLVSALGLLTRRRRTRRNAAPDGDALS